ncbi:Putative short-chain dehydrogenase/reductase SDR, NAD(P)-binding domain superfamily [Septoria linicola]|uniref:Short-chain dehydrogenase/reductase SDR, NAD(P)-binding domain superfamily n=1 Tax=Septoria linicola TaxID=215465 RepID=A0A9Q9EI92_9PEZI|nr:putative short-chain dehydrogenase/reductase SDR, NAD(P)-binding domain superfamily [Septoria linicola]USW50849.1 Putative short-chain dehydrogenase/reductase SDR, NAD(P)-binding domain superfamily [Septoria linicola]
MAIPDLFDLSDSTIIVTGGSGGLGLQLIRAILQRGADVACIDYNATMSAELELLTSEHERSLVYHACDVTDADAIGSVVHTISKAARHPIKGLVTCAGIPLEGPAIETSMAKVRRQIEVNLIGTMICAQAVARVVKAQGHAASFVLIGSMSGHIVNTDVSVAVYAASKAGVIQLARNLAAEWGRGGAPIRVNTISPGYIKTPMLALKLNEEREAKWSEQNMLGRWSKPEEDSEDGWLEIPASPLSSRAASGGGFPRRLHEKWSDESLSRSLKYPSLGGSEPTEFVEKRSTSAKAQRLHWRAGQNPASS